MSAHPRLRALLQRLQIPLEHGPAAQLQADALARSPGIDDPLLVDRTPLPLCTIDEPHSRDLDQALFVEAFGDGHRVWYAIADAAHFVRPGTPLWEEALRRGSSYYLPGLVVPMLPRVLSEDIVSLNPGVDRRALLFVVELDGAGRVQRRRLERARVRSRAKLSYQGVQAWYDGSGPADCDSEVQASLRALAVAGRRRMARAEDRGVVPFRRREVELSAQLGSGQVIAYEDLRRDVERYNEQISLLCNVEGARFLVEEAADIHPIYRVHPPPAERRLASLEQRVRAMVRGRGLDPVRWAWNRQRSTLAAWLSALPSEGEDGRIAEVLHRQAIVSCGRAGFTATPGGHHGIGADIYGRFTAPMREVVGVYLHGEATERLGGPPSGPVEAGAAQSLRDAVIAAAERSANHQKALDREANRVVLDRVFTVDLAHGGGFRHGTLMGLTRRKLHVRLEDPPLDVKVYLHHLERQAGHRLRVDDDGIQLLRSDAPVLTLGDRLALSIGGQDPDADRWALHLAGEAAERLRPSVTSP